MNREDFPELAKELPDDKDQLNIDIKEAEDTIIALEEAIRAIQTHLDKLIDKRRQIASASKSFEPEPPSPAV